MFLVRCMPGMNGAGIMANDFFAVSALSISQTGSQALSRGAKPATSPNPLSPGAVPLARPPAGVLPSGATQIADGRAPANLGVSQARTMVRASILAADQILNALASLADSVGLAAQSSLSSGLVGVQPGGTRISGVNIQASASRLLQAIDNLVDSVGTSGVNLISGSSRSIQVQTTEFGGRLTIAPQPLDTASLGIADLATIDRSDAQGALGRIESAQRAVLSRLQTLESIERALEGGSGVVSREVSRAVAGGDGLTSRGALVDISI